MTVPVVCKILGRSPREDGERGEVGGSIVWLARVDALVAAVLSEWPDCAGMIES